MHLYKSTVIKMSKIFFFYHNYKSSLMFSQSWQSTTLIMPREMQNLQVAFSKSELLQLRKKRIMYQHLRTILKVPWHIDEFRNFGGNQTNISFRTNDKFFRFSASVFCRMCYPLSLGSIKISNLLKAHYTGPIMLVLDSNNIS